MIRTRTYTPEDVDRILQRHKEHANEGRLIGLAAAAISGAVTGVLIVLAIQFFLMGVK